MIEQLQFSLRTAETPRLPSAWAYRIYGWLMAQLPADTAARLHEQGEHPLSQSLCFDAAAQLWCRTPPSPATLPPTPALRWPT